MFLEDNKDAHLDYEGYLNEANRARDDRITVQEGWVTKTSLKDVPIEEDYPYLVFLEDERITTTRSNMAYYFDPISREFQLLRWYEKSISPEAGETEEFAGYWEYKSVTFGEGWLDSGIKPIKFGKYYDYADLTSQEAFEGMTSAGLGLGGVTGFIGGQSARGVEEKKGILLYDENGQLVKTAKFITVENSVRLYEKTRRRLVVNAYNMFGYSLKNITMEAGITLVEYFYYSAKYPPSGISEWGTEAGRLIGTSFDDQLIYSAEGGTVLTHGRLRRKIAYEMFTSSYEVIKKIITAIITGGLSLLLGDANSFHSEQNFNIVTGDMKVSVIGAVAGLMGMISNSIDQGISGLVGGIFDVVLGLASAVFGAATTAINAASAALNQAMDAAAEFLGWMSDISENLIPDAWTQGLRDARNDIRKAKDTIAYWKNWINNAINNILEAIATFIGRTKEALNSLVGFEDQRRKSELKAQFESAKLNAAFENLQNSIEDLYSQGWWGALIAVVVGVVLAVVLIAVIIAITILTAGVGLAVILVSAAIAVLLIAAIVIAVVNYAMQEAGEEKESQKAYARSGKRSDSELAAMHLALFGFDIVIGSIQFVLQLLTFVFTLMSDPLGAIKGMTTFMLGWVEKILGMPEGYLYDKIVQFSDGDTEGWPFWQVVLFGVLSIVFFLAVAIDMGRETEGAGEARQRRVARQEQKGAFWREEYRELGKVAGEILAMAGGDFLTAFLTKLLKFLDANIAKIEAAVKDSKGAAKLGLRYLLFVAKTWRFIIKTFLKLQEFVRKIMQSPILLTKLIGKGVGKFFSKIGAGIRNLAKNYPKAAMAVGVMLGIPAVLILFSFTSALLVSMGISAAVAGPVAIGVIAGGLLTYLMVRNFAKGKNRASAFISRKGERDKAIEARKGREAELHTLKSNLKEAKKAAKDAELKAKNLGTAEARDNAVKLKNDANKLSAQLKALQFTPRERFDNFRAKLGFGSASHAEARLSILQKLNVKFHNWTASFKGAPEIAVPGVKGLFLAITPEIAGRIAPAPAERGTGFRQKVKDFFEKRKGNRAVVLGKKMGEFFAKEKGDYERLQKVFGKELAKNERIQEYREKGSRQGEVSVSIAGVSHEVNIVPGRSFARSAFAAVLSGGISYLLSVLAEKIDNKYGGGAKGLSRTEAKLGRMDARGEVTTRSRGRIITRDQVEQMVKDQRELAQKNGKEKQAVQEYYAVQKDKKEDDKELKKRIAEEFGITVKEFESALSRAKFKNRLGAAGAIMAAIVVTGLMGPLAGIAGVVMIKVLDLLARDKTLVNNVNNGIIKDAGELSNKLEKAADMKAASEAVFEGWETLTEAQKAKRLDILGVNAAGIYGSKSFYEHRGNFERAAKKEFDAKIEESFKALPKNLTINARIYISGNDALINEYIARDKAEEISKKQSREGLTPQQELQRKVEEKEIEAFRKLIPDGVETAPELMRAAKHAPQILAFIKMIRENNLTAEQKIGMTELKQALEVKKGEPQEPVNNLLDKLGLEKLVRGKADKIFEKIQENKEGSQAVLLFDKFFKGAKEFEVSAEKQQLIREFTSGLDSPQSLTYMSKASQAEFLKLIGLEKPAKPRIDKRIINGFKDAGNYIKNNKVKVAVGIVTAVVIIAAMVGTFGGAAGIIVPAGIIFTGWSSLILIAGKFAWQQYKKISPERGAIEMLEDFYSKPEYMQDIFLDRVTQGKGTGFKEKQDNARLEMQNARAKIGEASSSFADLKEFLDTNKDDLGIKEVDKVISELLNDIKAGKDPAGSFEKLAKKDAKELKNALSKVKDLKEKASEVDIDALNASIENKDFIEEAQRIEEKAEKDPDSALEELYKTVFKDQDPLKDLENNPKVYAQRLSVVKTFMLAGRINSEAFKARETEAWSKGLLDARDNLAGLQEYVPEGKGNFKKLLEDVKTNAKAIEELAESVMPQVNEKFDNAKARLDASQAKLAELTKDGAEAPAGAKAVYEEVLAEVKVLRSEFEFLTDLTGSKNFRVITKKNSAYKQAEAYYDFAVKKREKSADLSADQIRWIKQGSRGESFAEQAGLDAYFEIFGETGLENIAAKRSALEVKQAFRQMNKGLLELAQDTVNHEANGVTTVEGNLYLKTEGLKKYLDKLEGPAAKVVYEIAKTLIEKQGVAWNDTISIAGLSSSLVLVSEGHYMLEAPTGIGKSSTIAPLNAALSSILFKGSFDHSLTIFADENKLREAMKSEIKDYFKDLSGNKVIREAMKIPEGEPVIELLEIKKENIKEENIGSIIQKYRKALSSNTAIAVFADVGALQELKLAMQTKTDPGKEHLAMYIFGKRARVLIDEAHTLGDIPSLIQGIGPEKHLENKHEKTG